MEKLTPRQTSEFRRSVRKLSRSGRADMAKLERVVLMLLEGVPLPGLLRDHPLKGDKAGTRELHIEPDWLLIYRIDEQDKSLHLIDTGSHSELFE